MGLPAVTESSGVFGSRHAVLFDLDGTLVDTAADLCEAANSLRREHGLPNLPLSQFRPWVSRGGRAMLEVAFPHWSDEARAEALADFLFRYGSDPVRHSRLFVGMERVLERIESQGLPWGIVTNKPMALAVSVVAGLNLDSRCGVLLGGDSLPQRKPDPTPLVVACQRLGVDAASAVYVGDDHRDMLAGKAAGMPTVAAAWGYLAPGDDIGHWGADAQLQQPVDLLDLLSLGR